MPEPHPAHSPPITAWGHVWRILVVLVVSGVICFELWPSQWPDGVWLLALDAALGIVAFVLMFFRRRWPVAIAIITTLLTLGSASAGGPSLLAFMSLATRRQMRELVPVGVLGVLVGQAFYFYQPSPAADPPWLNFTWLVIITVAMAAIGMYVGSRRELVWSLRERARAAESERELWLSQAKSAERERIAREMHDVLAHRISLVSMHAGALAYREDLTREEVRETAELINATSHQALNELRQVLGTLRSDDEVRPQPSYADIASLLADDDFVDCEDLVTEPVPDHIGRTAYRIVQEALTNARRHAPGQPVSIVMRGGPGDGLTITSRNPLHPFPNDSQGSGLGLIGMRERIEIAGGRFHSGVGRDGSFELQAWLPWPA